jgi:hypothetical protein
MMHDDGEREREIKTGRKPDKE